MPDFIGKLPTWLRGPVGLVAETFEAFFADDVPRLAASISYFLLLATAPILLIANALLGVIGARLGTELGPGVMSGAVGSAGSGIQQAVSWAGSYAPYVALVLVIVGAVSVFGQFIAALEAIWNLPPNRTPIRAFLRYQAWSLGLLGVATAALVIALVVGSLLVIVGAIAIGYAKQFGIEVPEVLLSYTVRSVVIYLMAAVLFTVAFTVAPDRGTRWRDTLSGALVTAALFLVGESVLSAYLGQTQRFSVFGAFQFFVVLIVWIYYSALVVLWGAELTRLLILRAEQLRSTAAASEARD
jgi:membrane protein